MARINIEPEKAVSYGKNIIENSVVYNNHIKKVYGIVDDLKVVWTGTAADRFVRDIESYRSDYEKFGKLISEFGQTVTEIGNDYKKLEDTL